MIERMSPTRRVRARALKTGASALAMALTGVWASPALAQCAPEPTQANGTVTCRGTDADGVRVTASGVTLTVASGASVSNTGAPAVTVEVPNAATSAGTTIAINGQVTGGAQAGIALLTGSAGQFSGGTTRLALTVASGGVLSGATALTMAQTPGNALGYLTATVDNAGTITGTGGIALRGDVASTSNNFTTSYSGFTAITNRAGGVITGGIVGPVGTMTNAGLIDGGAGGAFAPGNANTSVPFQISPGAWSNTGTIRSNGSAATIASASIGTLTNSGTIANAGSGAALLSASSAFSGLIIQNQAGGQITSGGTVAITGTGSVNLTNRGTITGGIVTGNAASTIDSSRGTINGAVTFGSGNDTLIVGYDGTAAPVTGITGTIDAGGGTNTQQYAIGTSTTVATPVTLLTGFNQLAFATDAGVTTTLGTGFVTPATIVVAGAGTLVNRAAIVTTGTAFTLSNGTSFANSRFTNEGTIRAGSAGAFAINANAGSSPITNAGTIDAANGGVISFQGGVVNTAAGTITAGGTAVTVSSSGLTNAGTIRSTGGIGAQLGGNVGTASTNSGTIQGLTAGVQTSGYLTNTGTITATGSGSAAVRLDSYGVLFNNAGGVVANGGGNGGQAVAGTSFNQSVVNAGTINGTVSLTSTFSGQGNSQRFIVQGGTLNGNLILGGDGLLFTDLLNTGPGQFAGITGTVTAASGAALRYRVTGAQSAVLGPVGPFAGATYELVTGASLSLTAPATVTRQLLLAGTGSVDLSADLTTTTAAAALAVTSTLATNASNGSPTGALAITSRGTITATRATGASFFAATGVSLASSADSVTNTGTIAVTDRNANNASTGILAQGGGTVVNTGAIVLDGATGISGGTITNGGSITQVAGGTAARGVANALSLDNSGTIRVGGLAVATANGSRVTNTGTIASTGGIAIGDTGTGSPSTIVNAAGATITGAIAAGGGGTAARFYAANLTNAGTITGSVDMGYGFPFFQGAPTRSQASSSYTADGGTIAGDLLFGDGADTLILYGASGVSGRIDGGAGTDTLIQARRASDTVTLGFAGLSGFEAFGVRAIGAGTAVTVRADAPVSGFVVSGDGSVVNTATVTGSVTVDNPGSFVGGTFQPGALLAGLTNQGEIRGGFRGETASFTNSGTVGAATLTGNAVSISSRSAITFANSGSIAQATTSAGATMAVSLNSQGAAITAANTGTIAGGFNASVYDYPDGPDAAPTSAALSFVNGGTVTGTGGFGGTVQLVASGGGTTTTTLVNSGTIEATGRSGIAAGAAVARYGTTGDARLTVTNTGTIRANAGGYKDPVSATDPYAGASVPYPFTYAASALSLSAGPTTPAQVTNAATGTIEATGTLSVALSVVDGALDLSNAGTIRGGAGSVLTADDRLGQAIGRPYLAGAIQTRGGDDRVVNTGSIIGSIDLNAGNDRIDNLGRIEGNVFLGAGNDTFLQRASATLIGTVDGGAGDDLFIVDATGGGAVNGDQFVNFERFSQIGSGSVAYSGRFVFSTVGVAGGTVTVAAGQTLTSAGAVTVTGSDANETVVNDGTIAGGVALGGGADRVVNRGVIGGAVQLGDGDDGFVEGPGSRVAGGVDGGAGTDTYTALLAGDRSGLGARTGFERLSVEGSGTLSLALDQDFAATTLTGTGLNATLAGRTLGAVTGSDGAETLVVDGDVASAALGAGADTLSLGTTRAAGRYDGGAGADTLRFAATAPVVLAGSATGFEQLVLAGGSLSVAGTLGSAGAALSLGDGAQALTVANGGTLAGAIDLGAGDDAFRLAAGGTLSGTVAGGAGSDTATVELAGARTLGAVLTGFETLVSEGTGTLTLTGDQSYGLVTAATDLAVTAGASLTAPQVRMGAGDQRFTIAGRFAGSVDGGAGTDTLAVSGGTEAAPVAFATVANVEAFAMTGGFATVSGTAALGSVDMSSGRLVGLSGSTIGAGTIVVRQGATFGSAGTVNGNLTVAGTLSPGASPGTMTVNGNVALQGGSVSVFELAPTAQDRLVVNGAVSIASGATLQLVPTGTLRPGASYDLIVASGGIAGGFTTVAKPDSLFGFVVQRADRIQLLGQFLSDAGFAPQVARSVAYANATLAVQPATSRLFAALPALLTANGASSAAAFARLTPEPYASATQLGTDNALALAGAARGPAFAAPAREGEGVRAYTFAQTLGGWHRLGADPVAGTAAAQSRSYGFLGGVGVGDATWSVGGFAGYLNDRQSIGALAARTKVDGFVAGVHGRYRMPGGFGLTASILYDGGDASTDRTLPGTGPANARYGLKSWVSDLSVGYDLTPAEGWTLRPRAGLTYLRTTRGRTTETGGSPFALTVARDRHVAGFADAGLSFGRSEASDAPLRPWVSLGVRYQIEGTRADAVAGYAGGGLGLVALGAERARAVGTASAGIGYRLTDGLDLFSTMSSQTGRDDHQESIATGLRLRF